MSSFRFKQFDIEQDNSAMKVNTDGVLLGAWMSISGTGRSLLDVGTGSGVIALMAAQRIIAGGFSSSFHITAIDIDRESLKDAAANFANSSFCSDKLQIEAKCIPLQELSGVKYDLIFSNPPYFINSLKAAEESRSNARHTDTLSQAELIKASMDLLKPGGRLALVLPATEGEQFLSKVSFLEEQYHKSFGLALHLSRLCRVHTTIKKPAKRWLMEFVFSIEKPLVEESELIMMSDGNFTSQYKSLTKDFYLNF